VNSLLQEGRKEGRKERRKEERKVILTPIQNNA